MSDKYQCHITINNRTTTHLKYEKTDFPWGGFVEGPVEDIPPKSEVKAFVAAGASFGPAGTEGTVLYRFEDDANVAVTIYFDIPTKPFSNNTVRATSSNQDVATTVEGLIGSGATESCTIRVVDGR
jgi:hypothetical protein